MPRTRAIMIGTVYLLFFFSGAAGLIYQVIWVRQFGNVFGNTVYSASLVIAVFMCGLGVGSYLAGIWADRRYASDPSSPLRAFGYCELAIAGMGLLIASILPRLGWLSAAISSYVPGSNGWHFLSTGSHLARYAVAVAMLVPITLLMGATLTLLIRYLVRRESGMATAGWRIGALYGINTAGAAAGAFLTDFALVPAVGLYNTQMVAALCNVVAAMGALRLARGRSVPGDGEVAAVARDTAVAKDAAESRTESRTSQAAVGLSGIALLLAGFAAMGMEIIWFRHIAHTVGSFRSVYSLLLTVILIGIWLGALTGGFLHRRFGRALPLFMVTQALFAVFALMGVANADVRQLMVAGNAGALSFLASSGWQRAAVEVWINLQPVLREVAIPAFFMGFAFPLANATIQRVESVVGRRAGLLYLANTVGAVAGALVAGFVLLPALGMQQSVTVLIGVTALGIVSLYLAARPTRPWSRPTRPVTIVFISCGLVLGTAFALWTRLPANHVIARSLKPLAPGEERLVVSEGVNEVVAVTDHPREGRRLLTNGYFMSATSWKGQRYMRAFSHIPLLSSEAPENVLVIAFGVGNTTHAAALHRTVRRLEVADLSEHILGHAGYFSATNRNVLESPNVSVFVNDGRQHLRMQPPSTYDLVTLEPPPIAHAGVASLYSREFFELVRSRLKPKGYLTLWLPAYQVPGETTLSIVRAFVEAFPSSVLLSGLHSELILMGGNDSKLEIDPALVQARLESMPEVRADLERIHLGGLTEIIGAFAASGETLARASRLSAPVTDDRPLRDHARRAQLRDNLIPADLFDLGVVEAWCPKCFSDGRPLPELAHLDAYLDLLARLYEAPRFLHSSTIKGPGQERKARIKIRPDAALEAAIAEHRYLDYVIEGFFSRE